MHEEIRINTRDGVTSIADEEEYHALVGKGNNSVGKKAQGEPNSSQKMARRRNSVKTNAFTGMNIHTMQPSVRTRNSTRSLQQE